MIALFLVLLICGFAWSALVIMAEMNTTVPSSGIPATLIIGVVAMAIGGVGSLYNLVMWML